MEEIMILISVIPLQSKYNMMTTTTPIIMRSPSKTIKQMIVVGFICTSVSLTSLVSSVSPISPVSPVKPTKFPVSPIQLLNLDPRLWVKPFTIVLKKSDKCPKCPKYPKSLTSPINPDV